MNYMTIKGTDIANGDGVRVSLFVSGCSRHCLGCFNQEAWDFNAGEKFTEETMQYLLGLLSHDYISGLTILGGEPLEGSNLPCVTEIAKRVRNTFPDKTIWVYTGYRYKEVRDCEIMNYIDVLVDGPFVESEKDISLRFRGSRNQCIIDVRNQGE